MLTSNILNYYGACHHHLKKNTCIQKITAKTVEKDRILLKLITNTTKTDARLMTEEILVRINSVSCLYYVKLINIIKSLSLIPP